MFFNSLDFAIFLPITFIIYWFLNKHLKLQNFFLLVVSYVFYGWWNWKFLSLIAFSTFVDYFVGILLEKSNSSKKRKILLTTSIITNIGLLCVFKYFNFFAENFVELFTLFGQKIEISRLKIILPVGISFYTFQTLSYSIDIYKRKLTATKDFISFAAFVSFFPQLVAGPIERAVNLLPQFYTQRSFKYENAVLGLKQILWGLVKKVVIADSCAKFANQFFNNHHDYNGSTLLLGAIFFAFQIYGDFSGYSDIAIGTSRLFGFELMKNFNFPYFSRDIAEFWRKWHISLSTWFRDYLYIPLGGSKNGKLEKIRNTVIIFVVSGFWHGANWTFIIWGALNAIYIIPLMFTNKNRVNLENNSYKSIKTIFVDSIQILTTFLLVTFSWIFFRSESLTQALEIIQKILSKSLLSLPAFSGKKEAIVVIFLTAIFMLIEWIGRNNNFAIETLGNNKVKPYRYSFYYLLIILIFIYSGSDQEFIYFQF